MAVCQVSTDYPYRGNRWNFLDTEEIKDVIIGQTKIIVYSEKQKKDISIIL